MIIFILLMTIFMIYLLFTKCFIMIVFIFVIIYLNLASLLPLLELWPPSEAAWRETSTMCWPVRDEHVFVRCNQRVTCNMCSVFLSSPHSAFVHVHLFLLYVTSAETTSHDSSPDNVENDLEHKAISRIIFAQIIVKSAV